MYLESIKRVVNYIEDNLDKPIRLNEIGEVAGYSMYHFDRIFKYTVGESVIEYVRKRKLTEASKELLNNNRIIDISIKYGYDSQQAFTKSFKQYYKTTPGKYKKDGKKYILLEKKVVTLDIIENTKDLKPKIIELDSFRLIGMEYYGSNQNNEIAKLFSKFNKRRKEIKEINSNETLGVCEHVDSYSNESEFSYIVGVRVKDNIKVPDDMVVKVIAKQKYVVFTHKGSVSKLEDTYRFIYSNYFLKSDYERANTPDFELYDERFTNEPNSMMDIYIPIKD